MSRRGEGHYASKLTEFDVRVMKQLAQAGLSLKEISHHFPQVSKVAIHYVVSGRTWKHV